MKHVGRLLRKAMTYASTIRMIASLVNDFHVVNLLPIADSPKSPSSSAKKDSVKPLETAEPLVYF